MFRLLYDWTDDEHNKTEIDQVKEAENLTEQLAECEQSLRDQSRRLEQAVESASNKDNERCREIKRLKKVHCEQAQELMDQAQEVLSKVCFFYSCQWLSHMFSIFIRALIFHTVCWGSVDAKFFVMSFFSYFY